jgi:hypothetical protein
MGSAQSQVRLASAFNTNVDERLASPWKCRSSEGAALECSPINAPPSQLRMSSCDC